MPEVHPWLQAMRLNQSTTVVVPQSSSAARDTFWLNVDARGQTRQVKSATLWSEAVSLNGRQPFLPQTRA